MGRFLYMDVPELSSDDAGESVNWWNVAVSHSINKTEPEKKITCEGPSRASVLSDSRAVLRRSESLASVAAARGCPRASESDVLNRLFSIFGSFCKCVLVKQQCSTLFYDPVPLYFRAPYIQRVTLRRKKMHPTTGESQVRMGILSGRRITRLG